MNVLIGRGFRGYGLGRTFCAATDKASHALKTMRVLAYGDPLGRPTVRKDRAERVSSLPPDDPSLNRKAYKCLIYTILSTQSQGMVTSRVIDRFRSNGLDMMKIYKMDEEELLGLMKDISLNKSKCKYIKQSTKQIVEQHNGIVPRTLSGLTSLPGVGNKIANIVLQFVFGESTGIAVDTHVHRVANRLRLAHTNTPD